MVRSKVRPLDGVGRWSPCLHEVQDFVIGAEFPWNPAWIVFIATGTAQFELALTFLKTLGQTERTVLRGGWPKDQREGLSHRE